MHTFGQLEIFAQTIQLQVHIRSCALHFGHGNSGILIEMLFIINTHGVQNVPRLLRGYSNLSICMFQHCYELQNVAAVIIIRIKYDL